MRYTDRSAVIARITGVINQLAACGINAKEGRHTALVDLAADLPPAVLASLLDVHIDTAIAWAARAQRDWSAYLAARVTEQAADPLLPVPHFMHQRVRAWQGNRG